MAIELYGQYEWDFGGSIGAANYLGDIGGKERNRRDFIADLKLAKTRWNTSVFGRYRYRRDLFFKAAFDYLRIEGDDKLSTNLGRKFRNLNFRNDIYSLEVTTQVHFYDNPNLGLNAHYRWELNAYFFFGAGGFFHSPKAEYQGSWVKLQPLQTEGYKYKKIGVSIPLGIGYYFTYRSQHKFGMELNWRKTFTDYLDDISGNYPDTPPPSQMGTALALRTGELPEDVKKSNVGAYLSHTWGMKRGDKTHKDNFMTISLNYSYSILKSKRKKSQWSFWKKKRTTRKIRARF